MANFDERCRELEDIRCECEQNRTITRDQYQSEIYQYANEEYSITMNIFAQYLFEQNLFYQDISKYFTTKIPLIESKLNNIDFIPIFGCDLIKHCSKRTETIIAYPIEICIRLLEHHLREEGLFRIGSSISKQKKFLNELNLQLIDKSMTLNELSYDPHVIANTLKQYLRELPNCLLTNSLYSQWNQIIHLSSLLFSSFYFLLFSFSFSFLVMNKNVFKESNNYFNNYLQFIMIIFGLVFFFLFNYLFNF